MMLGLQLPASVPCQTTEVKDSVLFSLCSLGVLFIQVTGSLLLQDKCHGLMVQAWAQTGLGWLHTLPRQHCWWT